MEATGGPVLLCAVPIKPNLDPLYVLRGPPVFARRLPNAVVCKTWYTVQWPAGQKDDWAQVRDEVFTPAGRLLRPRAYSTTRACVRTKSS
jgi:hypothetical protein